MRKLLTGLAAGLLAVAIAGCATNPTDTVITFKVVGQDALTGVNRTLPVVLTIRTPGFGDRSDAPTETPAELVHVKRSNVHEVHLIVDLQGGDDNSWIGCSWTAQTPRGPRSSARYVDSEDEGTGFNTQLDCSYKD